MNQIKTTNMRKEGNSNKNQHIRYFSPQNRCKVGTLMESELSQKINEGYKLDINI